MSNDNINENRDGTEIKTVEEICQNLYDKLYVDVSRRIAEAQKFTPVNGYNLAVIKLTYEASRVAVGILKKMGYVNVGSTYVQADNAYKVFGDIPPTLFDDIVRKNLSEEGEGSPV